MHEITDFHDKKKLAALRAKRKAEAEAGATEGEE